MKSKLLAAVLFLIVAAPTMAADLSSIVKAIDAGADIQSAEREVTIITSAQRVTPHEAPFTEIIPALCSQSESLSGLDKVIVLNRHAFNGVEFWTYGETDDLVGICSKVNDGTDIQMFAVMH